MSYDNTGKASSWPAKTPKHPRKIVCYAHRDMKEGEEFEVALWPNVSDNEKAPDYTGVVQNKWVPDPSFKRQQPAEREEFDDDIPFS